jgi:hypothetical protein
MTKQHTATPWHVGAGNGEDAIFADSGRMRLEPGGTTLYPVCTMVRGWDEAEDQANARLIAAAPCMLFALQFAESHLADLCTMIPGNSEHPRMIGALSVIRGAIAKATGGRDQ